jgi:DNA processing protein
MVHFLIASRRPRDSNTSMALEQYIALNMMQDIGPVRVRSLMEHLGSISAIFEAGVDDLARAPKMGLETARRLVEQRGRVNPAVEREKAEAMGARILCPEDADYPEALRQIHDPPLALYVLGTLDKADRHAIAVVGTRRCSHYGRTAADRLAFQLAKQGYTVVSGLARGIDTAAHEGALKGGGRTLAVLGSALDQVYPAENAALAEKIAKQGAVLSEFPLGTAPGRTTFPMRNRIVSGLCKGVLVVEASRESGTMITVDEATSQGRLIFAVVGGHSKCTTRERIKMYHLDLGHKAPGTTGNHPRRPHAWPTRSRWTFKPRYATCSAADGRFGASPANSGCTATRCAGTPA